VLVPKVGPGKVGAGVPVRHLGGVQGLELMAEGKEGARGLGYVYVRTCTRTRWATLHQYMPLLTCSTICAVLRFAMRPMRPV
jgi:hypothetical protein